jgi:hypothetical protein
VSCAATNQRLRETVPDATRVEERARARVPIYLLSAEASISGLRNKQRNSGEVIEEIQHIDTHANCILSRR